VLHGVELACGERGIQLSYATFSNDAPNGDRILNRLRQNPVDGLLLLSLDDSALIDEIRSMNMPMVMLNVDRPEATEDAFSRQLSRGLPGHAYLIEQGHERILHITQLRRRTIQRRTEAYQDTLAKVGFATIPPGYRSRDQR
jgi:DNA-binding LacI/PurR family transcriptional regulator